MRCLRCGRSFNGRPGLRRTMARLQRLGARDLGRRWDRIGRDRRRRRRGFCNRRRGADAGRCSYEERVDSQHRGKAGGHVHDWGRSQLAAIIAVAPHTAEAETISEAGAARTGIVGIEAPGGWHANPQPSVLDPRAPRPTFGCRRGDDRDPRHTISIAIERKAVHRPRAALVGIRWRAGRERPLLTRANDLMALFPRWREQGASAQHRAGIRHDQQFGGDSGAGRTCQQQCKGEQPGARSPNAHANPRNGKRRNP